MCQEIVGLRFGFTPDHEMPDADERNPDEGPDEMFRFIKVMK